MKQNFRNSFTKRGINKLLTGVLIVFIGCITAPIFKAKSQTNFDIPFETNIPINTSPLPSGTQYVDMWGNPWINSNNCANCFIVPIGYGGGLYLCNKFKLAFADEATHSGIGFDDQTVLNPALPSNHPMYGVITKLGELRRWTACQVFDYISSTISFTATTGQEPDIYFPVSLTSGTGPIATGTPFFNVTSPNGFEGGFLRDHIVTGVNPTPGVGNYDGQITCNFSTNDAWISNGVSYPFNDDAWVSSGINGIDLFSVLLHEATHALGFFSFIDYNGNSMKNGTSPGRYSLFDRYIQNTTPTYLINSTLFSFQGNMGDLTSKLLTYHNTTNTLPYYSIYSPQVWSTGSSVSHIDNVRDNNNGYVMRPNYTPGSILRTWSQPELEILCNLGYTINSNNFICGDRYAVGVNDIISSNSLTTPVSVNVIANDYDPDGQQVALDVSSVSLLTNTGTVSTSGNTITFTPSGTYCGTVIIQYRPYTIVTGYTGSWATLTINITCPNYCPNNPCNLICHGDFEHGTIPSSPNFQVGCGAFIDNWCTRAPSPDYFNRASTGNMGMPNNVFAQQLPGVESRTGSPNNNGYAGGWVLPSSHFLESISTPLVSTLILGQSYNLSFWVRALKVGSGNSVTINSSFSNTQPPSLTSATSNNFVGSGLVSSNVPLTLSTDPLGISNNWTNINYNFTAAGNENYLVIEPKYTGSNDAYIYYDDFTLTPVGINLIPTVTVSNPHPYPGQFVTFTITVTNSGTAAVNGVNISNVLPAGLTFINSTFGSYPTHAFTSIAAGASASVTVTAQVPLGFTNFNTNLSDCASITSTNNCLQSQACGSINVLATDISVTTTHAQCANSITLTISNLGSITANNVLVNYTPPSCFGYTGYTVTTGVATFNGSAISILSLATGSSVVITFNGSISGAGCVNSFVLQSLNEYDYNLLNNGSTVNAFSCCTPPNTGTATVLHFNNITASALINYFQNSPYSAYVVNNNTIDGFLGYLSFDGNLTIDIPFTFKLCPNLVFAKDVSVIINPNQLLTLRSCHLYSCDQVNLWHGIIIPDNTASLYVTDDLGQPIFRPSLIEDAKVAVESSNGGVFQLEYTTFRRNEIGLKVNAYNQPLSTCYVKGCIFDGSLNGAGNLSHPLLQNNITMHNLGMSDNGISVNGNIQFNIGTTAAYTGYHSITTNTNTFEYMASGIDAQNTNVTIQNCLFNSIHNQQYTAFKSCGIRSYDNQAASGYIPPYPHAVFVAGAVGNLSYLSNTFNNCDTGVFVLQQNADIEHNSFNYCPRGIIARHVERKNVSVLYNDLQFPLIGISIEYAQIPYITCFGCSAPARKVKVAYNAVWQTGNVCLFPTAVPSGMGGGTIYGCGRQVGIRHLDYFISSKLYVLQGIEVDDNIMHEPEVGIYTNTATADFIHDNSVHLPFPTNIINVSIPKMEGIRIENSKRGSLINCNQVSTSNNSRYNTGIYLLQSANLAVKNNLFSSLKRGIIANGSSCKQHYYYANDFYYCDTGIVKAVDATINTEIGRSTANQANWNTWTPASYYNGNNHFHSSTWKIMNTAIPPTNVLTDPAMQQQYVNIYNTDDNTFQSSVSKIKNNAILTSPTAVLPANCHPIPTSGNGWYSWMPNLSSDPLLLSYFRRVAHDSIQYGQYADAEKWTDREELLRLLAADSSYLTDSIFNNFAQANAGSNFDLFQTIYDQMAVVAADSLQTDTTLLNSLLNDNSSITPDNICDANRQTVINMLLKYVMRHQPITAEEDVAILYNVASQCIYSGCTAVSEARAILETVTHYDFDDEQICGSEYNYRMMQQFGKHDNLVSNFKCSVYPNPTDDLLQLAYTGAKENMQVVISDLIGKVHITLGLTSGDGKLTINSSKLPTGLYMLTVKQNNNCNVYNSKISVVH